jgi:N-methylhydantoinase B
LELLRDTGGAGKYRGGCALRKDVELLCEDATLSLLGDRHKNPPYGIFGGEPGACAQTSLIRDGEETELGSKEVRLVRKGDVISFRVAGGGGYGNPKDREKQRILDDIRDGYVSRSAAISRYGLAESETVSGALAHGHQ